MHTAAAPKKALKEWLQDYPSEVGAYGHLLLEQRQAMSPETRLAMVPYFESAHVDARECFHKLARISLHPDDRIVGCAGEYPVALPLTARKGLFGEVMSGMFTEAYEFVGKHEWLIPVFLFRNHEDAGQYIYTLNRDPGRKREVLGRKGDDFIAIVVDECGTVVRFIAGEAKWRAVWNKSTFDTVMLGPRVGPEGKKAHNNKGVWFELNRALPVPQGLQQLHAILEEREPEKYASVIASLDHILAQKNPQQVQRTDLIVLIGGGAKQRKERTSLIPWREVPAEYKAGRDLQVVEVMIEDGDEVVAAIYDALWANSTDDAGF